MLAILDPELRHSGPSRWQSAGLIGSLALVALVVGAAAPSQKENPATVSPIASNEANADESAQTSAPQERPMAAPVPKAEPQYPNSGVRGVGSAAQQMIEQATQVTRTKTVTETQAQTQTQTQTQLHLNDRAWSIAQGDPIARPEQLRTESAKTAQGRADDRPMLLANVLRTDSSASLRRIAAWGLSEYAETSVATEALATALRRDSNSSVREMAAWALGHGDSDHPTAIDALSAAIRSDSDPKVRGTAVWALGQIGDKSTTESLAALLSDRVPAIRMRAVWAIGQITPRQAPRALIDLLRDPDPEIREITAWALYEIEDPAAVPALDAALRAESDKKLQFAYIRALAATGEKSVDAVRRLLDSKDPQIKAMAVRALAGGHATGPWPWPWPEPRPFP